MTMNETVSANEGTSARLPRVVVLGGGPAGLAAAHCLAKSKVADVSLLERATQVGGNAGSFELEGIWCDHGSHRLHAVVEPRVMEDVRALLGDDLLWRPRHGRILLQGAWIHFPLKPMDLVIKMPKALSFSLAFDALRKVLPSKAPTEENFATILRQGLGPSMCESFYYPYVEKLWGLKPEQLAVTLAKRRVSGSSPGKILGKVVRQIPGLGKKKGSGFYYPREGFGMISTALKRSAEDLGAKVELSAPVKAIHRDGDHVTGVSFERDGQLIRQEADGVWSTLPLTAIARMMDPGPPPEVIEAAKKVRFRGMILIYLILETDQFTEYDAHYFPELSIPISRMSEPKNYSASEEPKGRTILCAELPCDPGQPYWDMSDEELGQAYCGWLASVDLPVNCRVIRTETRRLRHAYPVYDQDYERHFRVVDDWLGTLTGFLSYGRQGLFAHDNTHHAMTMAYAAVDCLQSDGSFDKKKWGEYRKDFEHHVVED